MKETANQKLMEVLSDENVRDILRAAIEIEELRDQEYQGRSEGMRAWVWHEVSAAPQTLNKLVTMHILKVVYKSNNSTSYRLVNKDAIKDMLENTTFVMAAEPEEDGPLEIPDDLFNVIVLHDEKKLLIRRALMAERPVHVLFVGDVSSAKTLFLQELERLPGAEYILGSRMSEAGVYDLMFEQAPRYLLIDEIDKIAHYSNISALLSLMETGVLSEAKHKRRRQKKFTTWVFAGCNDESRLPPEILSRFGAYRLHFRQYTAEEYVEVASKVIEMREGFTPELAEYVAHKVRDTLGTRDVRTARSIARTARTKEDVDFTIDLLMKQRR